jgi:hypothetical protein
VRCEDTGFVGATPEMNPDLPEIDLALPGEVARRTLAYITSTEPTFWCGAITLPEDRDHALRCLSILWDRASGWLASGAQDFRSARGPSWASWVEKAAGKRVVLRIEMTSEDAP